MKFKDRLGKEVTGKEFMSRWKQGMMNIDPYTLNKYNMLSTLIVLIGVFLGIIVSLYRFKEMYWLTITLVGVFLGTLFSLLGLYQRYVELKPLFKLIKQGGIAYEQESTASGY